MYIALDLWFYNAKSHLVRLKMMNKAFEQYIIIIKYCTNNNTM